MAKTSTEAFVSIDDAWPQLQELSTWEGVAEIEDLRNATYNAKGDLTGFEFGFDTALGHVDGVATVTAKKPSMQIRGEQKGLEISIDVVLRSPNPASVPTTVMVDVSARATSFMTKPVAMTLNSLLNSAIDEEAQRIADRLG